MLNKYVILVTLVVNSLSDNHDNEVESLGSTLTQQYGTLKCTKPTIANGVVKPSTDISVFETYTVVCNDNFHIELGDKKIIGVNPVLTCIIKDGEAKVTPDESARPKCVNTDWEQFPSEFIGQVTANAASKHAVEQSQVGCWQKGRSGFEGSDNLSQCARQLIKYIDVGCSSSQGAGSIFVGYNSLRIWSKEEAALWGQDVIGDQVPKMKIYMGCLPAEQKASICMKVDQVPALSSKKLYVKHYSVPVPTGDQQRQARSMNIRQSDEVHYRLRCDDGYSFPNTIDDDSVYGYCTKASVGGTEGDNEFYAYTKDTPDTAINCYAKCPVNPDKVGAFSGDSKPTPVFSKLFMPSLKKGESSTVTKDGVQCAEGHALAEGAPETYKIDCQGAEASAAAYSGVLSCTDCPVCYAKCPENPDNADKFKEGENPIFKQLVIEELPKGKQISLAANKVTCEDGHALAQGAPESYAITCSDGGKLSCGDSCPKCYAKCPANPDNADKFKAGETPIFKQLEIAELIKGQQVTLALDKVTCADGHSLEDGAPESYAITCSDDGKLSCGQACPKCYAMCPENPDKSKFAEDADMIIETLTMPSLKKGAKHTLNKANVNCGDNKGVAEDAPATYEIACGDAGVLACATCPKCYAQCAANPTEDKLVLAEDSGIKSLKIAENMNFKGTATVNKADIVCKENYAMSDDAPASFTFTCGADGKLTCAEGQNGCPKCEGTCSWPAATEGDDGYDFQYVDEKKNEGERAEHAIPGINHVEAYCKKESLAIKGPRLWSCIKDNTMVLNTTGFADDAKPVCQADPVCEAPATEGGLLDKTGNIGVGEKYSFTCSKGYMFDLDTQAKIGSDKTAVEIKCVKLSNTTIVNDKLPIQKCYKGCKQTEGFEGKITPAEKRSGGPPYSEGQVVTFTCNENYELADSSKGTDTCTNGKIGTGVAPKCKKEEQKKDPNDEAHSIRYSFLLVTLLLLAVGL